ncbi:MAG TPA: sugar phosphate isomerase/epimerase [bacterium]|nr:sugar phosphate isomerase/epimerase [bacterium]
MGSLSRVKKNRGKPGVGIDNYCLYPADLDPIATLKWAAEHGAEGVQFSGLKPEHRALCRPEYLKDLAAFAEDHGLYIEWGGGQHIPVNMETGEPVDLVPILLQAAGEARILGTRIIRSCSGGLMRWNPQNPETEALLDRTAKALKACRSMLMDHGVILAVETHFEFTSFELIRLFERCGARPGEFLGIDLDTMNLFTMLENPEWASDRLLQWVVATHVKDGGILLNERGLTTFPAAIGRGVVPLEKILKTLSVLSGLVNWSIEDHGGEFHLPVFDPEFVSRFPDLRVPELMSLIECSAMTGERIRSGECRITSREEWPGICEKRVVEDLEALKKIRNKIMETVP